MPEQKPLLEELAEVDKAVVTLTDPLDGYQSGTNEPARLKLREYILQCYELLKRTSREGTLDMYHNVNTTFNATRGLLRHHFRDYVSCDFVAPPRTSTP